jgi:hypothetical protein
MPYKLAGGRLVFRIVLWGPEGAGKRTFLSWFGEYVRAQARRAPDPATDPILLQAPGMLVFAMPSVPGVGWQLTTAGPGRPDSYNQQVLLHADAVIMVFSAENWAWEASLDCLHALVSILGSKITPPADQRVLPAVPLVVCANKWDSRGTIIDVRMREALNALDLQSSAMYETVATDGTNLKRAFVHACRECVLRHYRRIGSSGEDPLASIEQLPEVEGAHDGGRRNVPVQPVLPLPEPAAQVRTTPAPSQGSKAFAGPTVQVIEDPRIAALKSVLRRAVDPEALKDAMVNFGFEKSIFNTEAESTAHYSCFRVQVIDGTPYIICPVPFLYDEMRRIEAGFAVDVDQDHFSVFAYMHDYAKKESIVLSKLPHCVHRAINLDAADYNSISDEVKEVSNEMSAMFFINSLVADLSIEGSAPIEFFDDKLYLQLLNRFVKVTDPRWFNHAAIGKKFDQLMRQFETLDVDDPFFQNNKLRAQTNIAQFLFGISDLVTANCFAHFLDSSAIQQHASTIHAYLETTEFLEFLFDFKGFSHYKVPALLELFTRGRLEVSKEYALRLFDYVYVHTASDTRVEVAIVFMKSTGVAVSADTIQDMYKELYARSDLSTMKRLRAVSGMKPEGLWIQGLFPAVSETQTSQRASLEKLAPFIAEMDLLLDLDPVHRVRVQPFLRRVIPAAPEPVVASQEWNAPEPPARVSQAPAVLAFSRATPPQPKPSIANRITAWFAELQWPHISLRPLAATLKSTLIYINTSIRRWWIAFKNSCVVWWRNYVLADAQQRFKLHQMRAIEKYMRECEVEQFFSRVKEGGKETIGRLVRVFTGNR